MIIGGRKKSKKTPWENWKTLRCEPALHKKYIQLKSMPTTKTKPVSWQIGGLYFSTTPAPTKNNTIIAVMVIIKADHVRWLSSSPSYGQTGAECLGEYGPVKLVAFTMSSMTGILIKLYDIIRITL